MKMTLKIKMTFWHHIQEVQEVLNDLEWLNQSWSMKFSIRDLMYYFFGQENILFVCFGLKLNLNPTLPKVWGTNDGVVGGLEGGGGAWK